MREFFQNLVSAFGFPLVGVVMAVYGVSQGLGGNWLYPSVSYLLMHDMGVHPYVAQTVMTVARLPWSIKILYGMMSDRVPLWGGKRRGPYLVLSSALGLLCWMCLSVGFSMSLMSLTLLLVGGYMSMAVPDVVLDAAVTERSKLHPSLAPSLQSLSWGSYATAGLIGSLSSGFLIDYFGARETLGLLIVPACAVLCAGVFLQDVNVAQDAGDVEMHSYVEDDRESRRLLTQNAASVTSGYALPVITAANVGTALAIAAVTLSTSSEVVRGVTTIVCALLLMLGVYFGMRKLPNVEHAETLARVAVYIFLREAIVPSVDAAMFAWYTMDEDGPGFTIEFLGFLSTLSLLAMLGGVALYQRYFKHYSYRSLFIGSHVLLSLCALFDVAFVTHANRAMGVPDRLFALGDTAFSPVVGRLSLMPMFALSAKLCPAGTEATLYALLMSLSNFGADVSSYLGAVLLWMCGERGMGLVTALLVRSLSRLLPVGLVFLLVPPGTPLEESS